MGSSSSKRRSALSVDRKTGFNALQLQALPFTREELHKLHALFVKHSIASERVKGPEEVKSAPRSRRLSAFFWTEMATKGQRSDSVLQDDHDVLNLEGFSVALKEAGVKPQHQDALRNMFAAFDRSGRKLINFREFAVGLSAVTRGSVEEQIDFAFDVYDADKSGYISEVEMFKMFWSVFTSSWGGNDYGGLEDVKQLVHTIFEKVDMDKDGAISRQEFHQCVWDYPVLLEFMGNTHALRSRQPSLSSIDGARRASSSETSAPRTPQLVRSASEDDKWESSISVSNSLATPSAHASAELRSPSSMPLLRPATSTPSNSRPAEPPDLPEPLAVYRRASAAAPVKSAGASPPILNQTFHLP